MSTENLEILGRFMTYTDGRYGTTSYYTWYSDNSVHILRCTCDDDDWNSDTHDKEYVVPFDSLDAETQTGLRAYRERTERGTSEVTDRPTV